LRADLDWIRRAFGVNAGRRVIPAIHIPALCAGLCLAPRSPTIEIVCEPCGRRGRYNVQRLIGKHGVEMRGAGLASPAPRVARRMPRRPRLNPLPAAPAAAQPPPYLGRDDRFRQSIHIHVSRAPASLAPRNNRPHAVLTHVRQRQRRPKISAASARHALIPLTALYGPHHADDELAAESRGT
jgi:hypothetical protein